jgi:transcriptional regulator with GAF, ATPase, and Fis domain
MGKQIRMIPPETMRKLTAYEWPGNVRELQNVIERAVILSSDVLTLDTDFQTSKPTAPEQLESGSTAELVSLEEAERRHIERILKQTNWLIEGPRGAATLLGVHPNTLRSRLRKLGLKRPE